MLMKKGATASSPPPSVDAFSPHLCGRHQVFFIYDAGIFGTIFLIDFSPFPLCVSARLTFFCRLLTVLPPPPSSSPPEAKIND